VEWVIQKSASEGYDFWLFQQKQGKLVTGYHLHSESLDPFQITFQAPLEGYLVADIRFGDKTATVVFQPDPTPSQVFLDEKLGEIQDKLFDTDPSEILNALEGLEPLIRPTLETPNSDCEQCLLWKYLTSLANELANHPSEAAQGYLEFWRNYPGSPYTILAKAKLTGTP
jgi:hypothetical protein